MNRRNQKLSKFKVICRAGAHTDRPEKVKVFIKSQSETFAVKYLLRCSRGFVFAFGRYFYNKVCLLLNKIGTHSASKAKSWLCCKNLKLLLEAKLHLLKRLSEKLRIWKKLPSPNNSIFEKLVRNGLTVLVSVLVIFTVAVAAPPTSPYKPAETLNPDCLPGTANCTVEIPSGGGGGGGGGTPAYMAKMRQTQAQSIPNDTWTKIDFGTEEYDVGDIASTSSDKFTIARDGKYLITTYWYLSAVINMTRVAVFVNGGLVEEQLVTGVAGENANPMLSTVRSLAAGDYVEMYVRHNYGSPANTFTGAIQHQPQMTVTEVSAIGSGGGGGGGGGSNWTVSGDNVYRSSGKVGIGTTAPAPLELLHTQSSGAWSNALFENTSPTGRQGIVAAADQAAISMYAYGSNQRNPPGMDDGTPYADSVVLVADQSGRTPSRMLIGSWSTTPLHFFTNDVVRMTVDTAGNVGIGTKTPNASYKLEVDGLIKGGGTVGAWSAERTNYLQSDPLGPWADIPGLSITFTLSRPALAQMTANGTQRHSGTPGRIHVGYRYVVDGTGRGDSTHGQRINMNESNNSWWNTWTVNDFINLAVGSHTIKVQARSSSSEAGTRTAIICGEMGPVMTDYSTCVLNIIAVYQ